mmetsp:Transcript_6695/g.8826  ORF Transcript_6695/g.8826 Transcript_6695/m.8826 type:complete len:282 (+) Transcript_6695:264-1109(+)
MKALSPHSVTILHVLSLLSLSEASTNTRAPTAFVTPPKTMTKMTNQKLFFGTSSSVTPPLFQMRHRSSQFKIATSEAKTATLPPFYHDTKLFFWKNNSDEDKKSDLFKIDNVSGTYDGVATFIQEWSKRFEGDGAKSNGLTTPVTVVTSFGEATDITDEDGEAEDSNDDDDNVAAVAKSGVKLIFKPAKTGSAYKSKEEEKATEEKVSGYNDPSNDKKKKRKPKKEGGVQIVVEKIDDGKLRVRAFRCEMDEDTIIKEMSEEAIISNLKKAMNAWKKQQTA